MNRKDITTRHWKLWEEQNKQIKRTMAASLVFAGIALFNIIIPYKGLFVEKTQIAAQIKEVETELQAGEAARQELDLLNDALAVVTKTLERRPWDASRYQLIRKYSGMRRQERGTPEIYQRMADSTVLTISAQVMETVYEPLAPFLEQHSEIREQAPEMVLQLEELKTALKNWEEENLGRVWYRTLPAKQQTIDGLSTSLDEKLAALSQTIRNERQALKKQRIKLDQKISQLESINLQDQEDKIIELQNRMMQVLPSWMRGLVSIEQLALYFPHLIAGILLFVLWLGRSLSFHFIEATADLKDKSMATNPALSSTWTLAERGRWGTLQSVVAYVLYAAAMVAAFEKGLSVLNDSSIAESLRASTLVFSPLFFWSLRAAMAGSFVYIIWERLLKKKN